MMKAHHVRFSSQIKQAILDIENEDTFIENAREYVFGIRFPFKRQGNTYSGFVFPSKCKGKRIRDSFSLQNARENVFGIRFPTKVVRTRL